MVDSGCFSDKPLSLGAHLEPFSDLPIYRYRKASTSGSGYLAVASTSRNVLVTIIDVSPERWVFVTFSVHLVLN